MTGRRKHPGRLPTRNQGYSREWSEELRDYIVQQLGAYRTKTAIYKEITHPDFASEHGFASLNPERQSLVQFRTKCGRIRRTEIEGAHQAWLVNWKGIPYATTKGRVEALQEMIRLLKGIVKDRGKYNEADLDITITDIIQNVRRLLRDIRYEMDAEAEREARAASGTNIYIGRSLSGSEITPELLNDTFIALWAEFGATILGLHHWPLDQLRVLQAAVIEAIQSKQKTIEAEFEIVGESNEQT
jgi:hypothetical protein